MNKQEYQKLLVFCKKKLVIEKIFPQVLYKIQGYILSSEELELDDKVTYRLAIAVCKKNNIDKLNVVCMENIFEELKNQIENKDISSIGNLVTESDLYDLSYQLVTSGCLKDVNYDNDEDNYNDFTVESYDKFKKTVNTMVRFFHKFSLTPRNHVYKIHDALKDVYALTMDTSVSSDKNNIDSDSMKIMKQNVFDETVKLWYQYADSLPMFKKLFEALLRVENNDLNFIHKYLKNSILKAEMIGNPDLLNDQEFRAHVFGEIAKNYCGDISLNNGKAIKWYNDVVFFVN